MTLFFEVFLAVLMALLAYRFIRQHRANRDRRQYQDWRQLHDRVTPALSQLRTEDVQQIGSLVMGVLANREKKSDLKSEKRTTILAWGVVGVLTVGLVIFAVSIMWG
jgi:hypothetical protein